jgi:hypothetical protein
MMGIFKKAEPEAPPPAGGGLDVLRGRAKALARTPQGESWLKDALRYNDVAAFLAGGPLPAPKIALLIEFLGMKAVYLPDVDLLKSTAPEPTSAGRPPDRYVPPPQVDYTKPRPLLSPETPLGSGMLKPADMRKPGWAS